MVIVNIVINTLKDKYNSNNPKSDKTLDINLKVLKWNLYKITIDQGSKMLEVSDEEKSSENLCITSNLESKFEDFKEEIFISLRVTKDSRICSLYYKTLYISPDNENIISECDKLTLGLIGDSN
mmetsp:Transcript_22942/g.20387  ORF Transcript_22942/g.20387 Transcript_22942/m.20387 type:complete len:124 (-) Transcript_22942:464-835(-)